jgi:limonene 1,2-monooxygenase
MPIHVADTRQEALDDTRDGAAAFLLDYTQAVTGRPSPVPGPRQRIVDQMVEAGAWAIGTPDDAIAAIKRLQERSGGFGGLMITGTDWAPREKILRSYELIARHVMPRFQGSLAGIEASNAVARDRARITGEERVAAVEGAQVAYERDRERRSPG